jgi:transcriptional regulator with XRE-family HTH domain
LTKWNVLDTFACMDDLHSTTATGLSTVIAAQGRQKQWVAASLTPPVSPSMITRWCQGQRRITENYLPQLAALLGVSEDEIASVRAER